MNSLATYTFSLLIFIAIIISGCSSDTDELQIHHYQYRSKPSSVALKLEPLDHEVSLLKLESYKEKILTEPQTYSF